MSATLERHKRGYGLILRRKSGQCLVVDGPAHLHFLSGECEALILHQDPDAGHVRLAGQCVSLPGPALIVWLRGAGRIGLVADRSTRALRGELLGGLFASQPLAAGLACRSALLGDGPVLGRSTTQMITHIRRTDEGILCPS